MINKIEADSWLISYHCGRLTGAPYYYSHIEYKLSDETNKKSHKFDTFEEAYQWIANQVNMKDKPQAKNEHGLPKPKPNPTPIR